MDVDELARLQDSLLKATRQQIQAVRDELHASILDQMRTCKDECFASTQKQVHNSREDGLVNDKDTTSLAFEVLELKRAIHQIQAEVSALQKGTEQKQSLVEEQKHLHLKEETEPHNGENHRPESPNSAAPDDADSTIERAPTVGHLPAISFYELEHSVWDYSMLIGLPDVGSVGSVCVLSLLLVNIIVQIFLILIIHDKFTVTVISTGTLDSMMDWRVMYGHSLHYSSDFTFQPMVNDVCHFTTPTPVGTDAGLILQAIEQYAPSREAYDYFKPVLGHLLPYYSRIGVVLSSFAILIWILNVWEEMEDVGFQVLAIHQVPVKATSEISYFQESCVLRSLSIGRKAVAYSVLMTQFVVVVSLGFAGVYYIINTIDMNDLLLNCSALTIVLQMDELLATCIPSQSKRLLHSLEPLPRASSKTWKGLSMNSVFQFMSVAIVMVASTLKMVSDAQVLEDTREAICGGNRRFVAAVDEAGVVIASKSPERRDWTSDYYYEAVDQLIHGGESIVEGPLTGKDMSGFANAVTGGPWSLTAWATWPQEQAISFWNMRCTDMLPTDSYHRRYAIQFEHILRDVLGTHIQSCSEVRPWCSLDDTRGVRARQICPVTCGCNTAGYSLVQTGSIGCPGMCDATSTYNTSLWSRECTDLDKSSAIFHQYAEGLESMMSSVPGLYNADILALIRDSGCDFISLSPIIFNVRWFDPCEVAVNRLKPFTYACPVSCNCRSNPRYLCPNQCSL